MRLALLHARAQTLELLRLPAYIVPTLAFPTMFYVFFAVPDSDDGSANASMALFAGFAILGVALFQFGVEIAAERASPWERYLRTLPARASARFGGRIVSALGFGLVAAALVALASLLLTPARLGLRAWLELGATLALGAIPFALLGIAIGYLASPKAALPIANVVYLSLSYAGGLWTTPEKLPAGVGGLSSVLPTRALADALVAAVAAQPWSWRPWSILAAYSALFAAAALWGYRRDEGQRYR
ncbi:MAG TPA: ABC transporter permease [Gaiellaceae bacterium]|nr:ABC transporter permease [Gaiellaceae bacterium]